MAKIVLFGINDFAELAHYYLTKDSEHEVVAFSVDSKYMHGKTSFKNLPLVAFESIEDLYPPESYSFFAPLSPAKMNMLRRDVYMAIKKKGYKLISYISSRAAVFDNEIGENCFILEDNTIQPFTSIGNNVILWSGNHIGHHSVIEDNVMFTSHVVMSGHCHISSFCTIGVNATLRDGITLAEGTFVAMGSLITKDTEPWGLYIGSPAKKGLKSSKDL